MLENGLTVILELLGIIFVITIILIFVAFLFDKLFKE
jgi:hypothetical protein